MTELKTDISDSKTTQQTSESSDSIRAVAIYEIIKGLGGLLAAAALWVWHSQLFDWLVSTESSWQHHFGNLLSSQIASIMVLAQKASQNWIIFFVLILIYTALRFVEAYGLWRDKTWAYWFSLLGYGLFIPLEVYTLIARPFDWVKLAVLVLNVIVVVVVYRQMRKKGLL